MEDKKTLGNEVSVQEEVVTEKLPLSKTSDISDATKIELAEDKKEDKKSEQLKLEELINIAGNFVRGKITMEELDAFGKKASDFICQQKNAVVQAGRLVEFINNL